MISGLVSRWGFCEVAWQSGSANVADMSAPPTKASEALGELDELAALARVDLGPAEKKAFEDQLASIVGYLESLQAIDLDGVEEFVSTEDPDSGLRPDETGPVLDRESALQSAGRRRGEYVLVPKFVEG